MTAPRIKFNRVLLILIITIILLYSAFYNGYPLVTSDSGAYIGSGFKGWIPADRPIFYGLFVRHMSLASSLWFTIIVQSIIMSFVIWQTINLFINKREKEYQYLFLVLILATFSSISWFTSQIMPDIFVGIGFLALLLILLKQSSLITTIFNSIVLLISCLCHNSNMLIFSFLILAILIYSIISKSFTKGILKFNRYGLAVLIILSSWLATPLINYSLSDKFEISGSPHVFLLAKNIENGIIDRYLDENCDKYIEKKFNDTTDFFIVINHSKKNIDIAGFSKNSGTIVHQWDFTGQKNQKFKIKKKNNYYKIISSYSGMHLDAIYDSVLSNYRITQMPSSDRESQLFKLIPSDKDSSSFFLLNKSTSKFLDLSGISNENGAILQLWDSTGFDNQKFIFLKGNHCLCLFKNELPSSAIAFLWIENGPFSKTGAWAWSKEEYSEILDNIFFSKEYFGANLGEALIATLSQLTRNDIGDGLNGYDNNSAPYKSIKTHLPYELKSFSNSKQNRWLLNFTEVNKRHFWTLIISILIILAFFSINSLKKDINIKLIFWIKTSFICITINAFVTGALANVLDRLESRIVWIVPFAALLIIFDYINQIIEKRKTKKT